VSRTFLIHQISALDIYIVVKLKQKGLSHGVTVSNHLVLRGILSRG
jgi:hypothetical protein